jgi:hypothetical protein
VAWWKETYKHWKGIQEAHQRKASVEEACPLFENFLAAQTKFIKEIEDNGRVCGAPPDLLKQIRENHAKASQSGKDVCEAAARSWGPLWGPRRSPRGNWPAGDYWLPGERRPGRF